MVYILCKNTCISKKSKDPKKKPKFRKYTDTFIDVFSTIEGVKCYLFDKISKTPKDQVFINTYKVNFLRRKYDPVYLNNVILVSVITVDKDIKAAHMYYVYCKNEPYDIKCKDLLTISKDEFKYIKSELKNAFVDNEEERIKEMNIV